MLISEYLILKPANNLAKSKLCGVAKSFSKSVVVETGSIEKIPPPLLSMTKIRIFEFTGFTNAERSCKK
ncbi:MAG: hypothetical protein ACKPKO_15415, partial [Candidatus Fonsibacter sp.]